MKTKTFLMVMTLLPLGALFAVASAADYPTKPIEILCPYTVGGSIDIMSRLIAEIAPTYMPQPIVVVNKPGAGGSLAAAEVIKARPDGHKLTVQGNMFFATTVKTQKIPFNPDDLVPIANFMAWRLCLAVRSDSPWKTLNDLLAYAKKNPGQLRWGHGGRGIPPHIIPLLIFKKAGVQTTDVPYKGQADFIPALLGGHIDAVSTPYGTVKEQAKAGLVRVLTVYNDQRYADIPDVPSCAELGFADAAKLLTYVALYIHKNTPEHIKTYLFGVSKKIYDDPRYKRLPELGSEDPLFGGPEFVRETIKRAEELGVPILKELGLYIGN